MENKTYSEKLKDPRWQKKRLEIMQRDKFMCIECGTAHKELHVHHKHYSKDTEIWDYPDHNFITLCNDCHETKHGYLAMCNSFLTEYPNDVLVYVLGILQTLFDKDYADVKNIEYIVKGYFEPKSSTIIDNNDLEF